MKRHFLRFLVVTYASTGLLFVGCGGGGSPAADATKEPFIAKGKLESEAKAKEALANQKKAPPQH